MEVIVMADVANGRKVRGAKIEMVLTLRGEIEVGDKTLQGK